MAEPFLVEPLEPLGLGGGLAAAADNIFRKPLGLGGGLAAEVLLAPLGLGGFGAVEADARLGLLGAAGADALLGLLGAPDTAPFLASLTRGLAGGLFIPGALVGGFLLPPRGLEGGSLMDLDLGMETTAA